MIPAKISFNLNRHGRYCQCNLQQDWKFVLMSDPPVSYGETAIILHAYGIQTSHRLPANSSCVTIYLSPAPGRFRCVTSINEGTTLHFQLSKFSLEREIASIGPNPCITAF